jgi:hypothetical protein
MEFNTQNAKHLPGSSDLSVRMTWAFCNAISLVGAKINTCTLLICVSTDSKAITPNTSVFPVPDFDWMTKSND